MWGGDNLYVGPGGGIGEGRGCMRDRWDAILLSIIFDYINTKVFYNGFVICNISK